MRRSPILDTVLRAEYHGLLLVSLYLLFTGHNQPGGGFAGGLVAGAALVLRFVAGGVDEVDAALPVPAHVAIGAGVGLAALTATVPLFTGHAMLDHATLQATLPLLGKAKTTTALFFDTGVYLVVVGMVSTLVQVLGAPADTHDSGDTARVEGAQP